MNASAAVAAVPGTAVLAWTGTADVPSGPSGGGASVRLRTADGAPAVLVLDHDRRYALASLLGAADAGEPCPTTGCGAPGADAAPPWGWIRTEVAGSGRPPRWVCSPWCAQRETAAAGDCLAAQDGREPGPPDPAVAAPAAPGGQPEPALPDPDAVPVVTTADALAAGARLLSDHPGLARFPLGWRARDGVLEADIEMYHPLAVAAVAAVAAALGTGPLIGEPNRTHAGTPFRMHTVRGGLGGGVGVFFQTFERLPGPLPRPGDPPGHGTRAGTAGDGAAGAGAR